MRIRIVSMLTLIALLSAIICIPVSAQASSVTLNAIGNKHAGESITIGGTTELSGNIQVKIVFEDGTILLADQLAFANNAFSKSYTIGDGWKQGKYTVVAGSGSMVDSVEFSVIPTSNGTGTTVTVPTPVQTPVDGKLKLPTGSSGKVSLGNDVTISIPAGAALQELNLTIEKVLETQTLLTNHEALASPIFEILKNFSADFQKPVTLTFSFDSTKVGDGQTVSVFYYDETAKEWVEVGGSVNGSQIIVDVNHFTKYAVMVVDKKEAPAASNVDFGDIAGHWAEARIKLAAGSGIVGGYPDGTFKPDKTVTRAEFAVMLMNALKPQGEGAALTFKDAEKIGAWGRKAVAQAVQADMITGYEDGTFRPNADITRAEMAVMIAKARGQTVQPEAAAGFADDKDIPSWARASVAILKQAGIVSGKGNNRFAPGDHATRAEAVTIVLNLGK